MSEVVGHRFRAWDGHFYICDSYDPRRGYWMMREDAPEANRADESGDWRRNVSERVIGRTYHYAPLPPQELQK
jgi:hypothetical protein